MKNIVIASAVALSLSACGLESDAKNAAKNLLNDPGSAEFSGLDKDPSGKNICGFLNAKNRMGGYVGKTPFFYQSESQTVVIAPPVDDSDFRSLWLTIESRSDFSKEYSQLHAKCQNAISWKTICGREYPADINELCGVITQGKGENTYAALRNKFSR